MALTLAESAKLSNDIVLQGVIETIVLDSPILQALPFIDMTGNGLTYNRENTNPAAAFFNVGDTWTEGTPTFSQITATLSIVGGDADIDNFLLTTRSNLQDLHAAVIRLKAKAVQQKFEDTFVNGDTAVDAKSFDGIDKLTTGGQIATMGTNGATLSLAKLDEVVDLVNLFDDLAATADSGISQGDEITYINAPTMIGTAEANTQVLILANGYAVGLATVGDDSTHLIPGNGLGGWEVTIEPLADGEYDIITDLEDLAGNFSPISGVLR